MTLAFSECSAGIQYYFNTQLLPYDQAALVCESAGGELAIPEDEDSLTRMAATFFDNRLEPVDPHKHALTGLRDFDEVGGVHVTTRFKTVDGETPTFTSGTAGDYPWHENHPHNPYGNHNCVAVSGFSQLLIGVQCVQPFPSICQRSCSPTLNPTTKPTDSPTLNPVAFELFPAEVRPGNGFVGVSFQVPVSDAVGNAFVSAARRWNDILAGNENLIDPFLLANFNICDLEIIDEILVDHLFIIATVAPNDGPGGVLASAGPCNVAIDNFIPIFGRMIFDSDDIGVLEARGSLESVILHEMGHVLGIGTLWTFVGLIQDRLPGSVANANLPSPTYLGGLGTQAFLNIGGVGALGIEDGFTNGLLNGAGPGSINGHFDEDSVDIELMTFRLKVDQPPLSTVTIQSLADLGYNVDITQADLFFLGPSLVGESTGTTDPIILQGDIWTPDILVPPS